VAAPLSIVFCGTPDFAVPSLRALAADDRFRIDLVVTQPDRPAGRGNRLEAPAVKRAAEELGLVVAQPQSLNASYAHLPVSKRPDILVVVAYGQIVNDAVLAWPTIAPVNVHGSLLPRWRGASPVEHAILEGDTETGVTVQIMERALDAGPILGMTSTPIGPRENREELRARLAEMGATLLIETLAKPLSPIPQPLEGITICRKLSRTDGQVDPTTMTAAEIDRCVRALVPWPGVTCTVDGEPLKIIATDLHVNADALPLPCAGGTTLHLRTVQPPSGKPMSGQAWARGRMR
jgi:methionyl-tRNA formyltransferase